ncbi:Hypothetical predicted protein [Paramuricea clavata]|uniref:Uncharacterized protein n=1 Tax=Paramuricea clavata TaxID=317549 RepID=A0A6S7FQK3_PARCT|nr:Hypothetical predicted protein [Paramuricea clavata]
MGKPDSEISDLKKKRIMRNCRKKRRRQQRAINKRTASEAVLARKVNDGLMEQKALAEKYHDKWRKLCREAKDLRRKIQSHSRKFVCIKIVLPRKLSDGKGISGKGQLTDGKIDVLENYYGLANREAKL